MSNAQKFLSKAQDCLKRNNLELAVKILHDAIKVEPGDPECRRLLRDITRKRQAQQGKGSMLSLKRAQLQIMAAQAQRKWASCDQECEGYLAMHCEDPKVLLASARALLELKAPLAAEVQLEAALGLDPKHLDVLKAYGAAMKAARNYAKARVMYQQAVKIAPNDREILVAIKDIEALDLSENKGWGSDARAVDLVADKGRAQSLEKEQSLVTDEDHLSQQIRHMSAKAQADKSDRLVRRDLWKLQRQAKDYQGAVTTLEELQVIEPNVFEYSEAVADVKLDHTHERIDKLRAQLAQSESADLKEKLTDLEGKRMRFQVKEWKRRVEHYPNNQQFKFQLGNFLLATGELDEAVKLFQAARKEPRFAFASDMKLGIIFYCRERHSMAAKQFGKLLAEKEGGMLDEQKMEIMYWVARTHLKLGEKQQAIDLIEEIMLEEADYRDVERLMVAAESGAPLSDDDVGRYLTGEI